MNKQEEMWAGKFGDEYTRRMINGTEDYAIRQGFWKSFFSRHIDIENILEVGCGYGFNLHNIPLVLGFGQRRLVGIDVNDNSLEDCYRQGRIDTLYGQATDIPFKDNFFDLVFTCGLLIHIPPDDLLPVMSEMVRCSHKYVMFMEYWAEKEEEIEYRGEMGLLWKRPYKDIFLSFYSRHSQYECIDEGFLTKDDGFDDVTWWLFERR